MIVRRLCPLINNGSPGYSSFSSYGFVVVSGSFSVSVYCAWRRFRESTLDLSGEMIGSMDKGYLGANDTSRAVVMMDWLCSRNMGFE